MDVNNENLVTVFASGNKAVIGVARSILDDAGIDYLVKNEGVEDLFGVGIIGTGYNIITGPIELQVLEENEKEARELLKDLSEGQVGEEG
jgi:hypothetical protein